MENLDKYNELLLTKNLEEQDNELFIKRCKKDLNQLVLRKKLSYCTNKKFGRLSFLLER